MRASYWSQSGGDLRCWMSTRHGVGNRESFICSSSADNWAGDGNKTRCLGFSPGQGQKTPTVQEVRRHRKSSCHFHGWSGPGAPAREGAIWIQQCSSGREHGAGSRGRMPISKQQGGRREEEQSSSQRAGGGGGEVGWGGVGSLWVPQILDHQRGCAQGQDVALLWPMAAEVRTGQTRFPGSQAHVQGRICSWVSNRGDRKRVRRPLPLCL